MKICWDNLDGLFLTSRGRFAKGNNSYEYMDKCCFCGEPYLTTTQSLRNGKGNHCGLSCRFKSDNPASRPEVRKKISESRQGMTPWNKNKKGVQKSIFKGKKRPEYVGKKNPNWKHGLSETNEYYCQHSASRRAQKRVGKESLTLTDKLKIDIYYMLSGYFGKSWEVDHVIPLSKGGKHHPDNLQIIPMEENRRKYNKIYGYG